MRILLIAIMIVLLPVRGWIGDAMALNMTLAPIASPATIAGAPTVHCHEDTTQAQTQAAVDAHDPDHTWPCDSTHPHASCDQCNGPAIEPLMPQAIPATTSPRPKAVRHTDFASHDAQRDFRPPIV